MKRICIVTGASSGMGKEFVKEIFTNSEKYNFGKIDEIWILARRIDRLTEIQFDMSLIAEKNTSKEYPRIIPIEANLAGRAGVNAVKALLKTEQMTEKNDGFEIALLINNAGFGTYGEFTQTPIEKELDMIDLNCTSLTGITGIAVPFMNRGCTIINIASLAAFIPLGNFAVYAATKSYVLSFSVALAAELKEKGICVTAVCPGSVSTEFANVASNGARKEVLHGKSAPKTVLHALKSASKRRVIALWAFKWKFNAFMSRFIGRFAGAWFTYKYAKRPCRY
ncbi:SDR family NAD(P)-dependent oxidoreductase [Treponema sp.]|uniref:SDR family NAD(P)-dependent oxidoreductase n=1 Tax=Treponema sp. TaxID=166 RepID=UPI0038906F76